MAGRLLLPTPNPAIDANGNPISGSKLCFYLNGTTTAQAIYSGPDLVTPLANPLPSDSAGRFPEVWCANTKSYTVVWKSAADVVLATYDDIAPSGFTDAAGAAEDIVTIADIVGLGGTGGFYSNHNALDGSRQDARMWVMGDRFIMGDDDDLKPGRTYYTITSITRSGTTATVTTSAAHGYSTGNTVQITGADQTEYCGTKTITVPDGSTTTFTYTVSGSPTTPATGDLRHSIISGTNSWLELLRASTVKNAQLIALSAEGFIGAIFGSRVSDNSITGEDCIGVAGWALNDGTLATDRCYAGLFEALTSGVGGALGVEIDIVNGYTTETNISANGPYVDGSTVALWLASGGEKATKPFGINAASAALGIVNNGETFLKGIVFGYNSIDGCTGSSGSGVAIEMITGHALQWLNMTGNIVAAVKTGGTVTTYAQALNFNDNGLSVQHANGTVDFFRVSGLTTDLNGVHVIGGATGAGVKFLTIGETNVDMIFETAGSGVIKTSDPLWVYYSGSTSGDPTNKGMIRLCNPGGAAGSSGGLEFINTRFGSGYGWRWDSPDEGGGSVPLIVYNRSNSASWTEHSRFVSGGGYRLPILAADPSTVANGDIYYNSTAGYAKVRAGGAWQRASFSVQTLAAYTADNENSAYTGIDNAQAGSVYAKLVDLNAARVALENLRTMAEDLRTKMISAGIAA